ncbi:MAG TPA: MOSC domain-containing protein [Thermoanaerobaculia bacterium]|nr:MOSC domain-containing protein [Thermoanaerobaculia bacterium]
MTGSLRTIWLKRSKRGPMDPKETATLVAGKGLAGNANQGGRRQVVLVPAEGWADALAELGAHVDPSARRGNLLVSGIDFEGTRGRVLKVGSCRLQIWTECAPCERMDEAHPGLRKALRPHWRAGACAMILDGGEVRVGDPVSWES